PTWMARCAMAWAVVLCSVAAAAAVACSGGGADGGGGARADAGGGDGGAGGLGDAASGGGDGSGGDAGAPSCTRSVAGTCQCRAKSPFADDPCAGSATSCVDYVGEKDYAFVAQAGSSAC